MFVYPLAITLILLALTEKWFGKSPIVYAVTTGFTLVAAAFDFLGTLSGMLPENQLLASVTAFAGKVLPFYSLGMGWIVPACLGFLVGLGLAKRRK